MERVAFPVIPTPLLVTASFVLGATVGATAAFTYIKRNDRGVLSRRRQSLRHTEFASPFSNGDGRDCTAFSSKKHSQQDESIGGQRRRMSRRSNSGADMHPGSISLRSLAAYRIGHNSRSSSINLILKSCLGAEGLGDEVLGEGEGHGDAKGGKDERNFDPFVAMVGAEEDGTSDFPRGDVEEEEEEEKGGNARNAPLSRDNTGSSSVNTLDGLFSESDASSEDEVYDGGQEGEPGTNPTRHGDACTTGRKDSTCVFWGRAGASQSLDYGLDKPALSCADFSDGNTRSRLLSRDDAVFSNRQFYHTHSGAIITRLPSVASVRCRSILQLLHASSSSHKDESTEDDGNRSHLTQSMRSTKSLLDDPIYRVVITGGPCSGKTSCLSYLRRVFEKLNFNVFCVPEVATLLHSGGVNLVLSTREERITQQRVILQMMMMLEDAFYELASMRSRPSLILYDRGTMDGSAYCSEEEWDAILKVTGYGNEELSDARYDAVVHLVTAAIGAEKFYTTENNAARSEGLEDARRLDALTLNAWRGHYLVSVVHNEDTNFEAKMMRVAEFVGCVTGISTAEDLAAAFESSNSTTVDSFGATTVTTATPVALSSGARAKKSPSLPVPLFSQPFTSVLSSQERKGGEEREGEEVAQMAFLATGTRAFANSASMATVSAHSFCNNNNNSNSVHSPPTPSDVASHLAGGTTERTPVPSPLSHTLAVDTRAERGGLQRHFFVNHVNTVQIPVDAVTTNVVTITLVPLRANYRTEVIIRLSRTNDAHPLYLRRVEHHGPEQAPPSPEDCEHELRSHTRGRHLARVQITRSAFLKLARRRDFSQPVIEKTAKRFFFNMRHFTLVTFQHPKELRGVCRLVAPADTTEEDIRGLAEVEPFSLLMREGVM